MYSVRVIDPDEYGHVLGRFETADEARQYAASVARDWPLGGSGRFESADHCWGSTNA